MFRRGIWILALTMLLATPVLAADFPTRAISVICPVTPGGTLDLNARAFATVAEKLVGKPVVVLNKPGASGGVGTAALAEAKPDGYTIGLGWSTQTAIIIQETVAGRKPPFTLDDFAVLGRLTDSPPLLVVNYKNPWKTAKEAIEDVKAHPGTYTFAGSGIYSIGHLPFLPLDQELHTKTKLVPTRGGGENTSLLLGGHVTFLAQYPGPALPLVKSKQVRALACWGEKRVKNFEDVPTFKELGYNVVYTAWVGLLAPKATPAPILEKLRMLVKQATSDPVFVDTMQKAGDQVDYADAETAKKAWQKEYNELYPLILALEKEKEKDKKQ
jgi:tripartite-type tricarboxylate transporter receptor subunit TctC